MVTFHRETFAPQTAEGARGLSVLTLGEWGPAGERSSSVRAFFPGLQTQDLRTGITAKCISVLY